MYPIKNPAKHLKLFKKELHTKRIVAWNYFPKTLQYVWQASKPSSFWICQCSEHATDTEGSEYVWMCSWIILKFVWICLKQNLKLLYKLRNIYRYTGLCQSNLWIFQSSEYATDYEYVWVPNMQRFIM